MLREVYYGETRFDAFIASLGIARNTLIDRLRKLVDAGLLERREYQTDPVRHEYVLTESGRDFYPVMAAMKTWGDRWMHHGKELPVILSHEPCGHELEVVVVCAHCGAPVQSEQTHAHAGPGFPRHLLDNPRIAARFSQTGPSQG